MTVTTRTIAHPDLGPVPVQFDDQGEGPVVLLLHGGGGPLTVQPFADRLAATARVVTPTHPGFAGTPRPESLHTIAALAQLYAALLEDLDLTDVTVVGNSIGGWIAVELALLNRPPVGRVVLVDAGGLELEQAPIADFFALTPDEVFDLGYYEPEKFRVDVAALPEPVRAIMAGNRAALGVYGGAEMTDPTLLGRLPAAKAPALVIWGAADRIYPPEHGRVFAQALPNAQFRLIDEAGHLPQLETPALLADLIGDFVRS